MGVSLTVEERCPVAEIVAAYRREGDAVRRSYLQGMWLLLDGMAMAEVSRVTGFGVRWIEKLIHCQRRSKTRPCGGAKVGHFGSVRSLSP